MDTYQMNNPKEGYIQFTNTYESGNNQTAVQTPPYGAVNVTFVDGHAEAIKRTPQQEEGISALLTTLINLSFLQCRWQLPRKMVGASIQKDF